MTIKKGTQKGKGTGRAKGKCNLKKREVMMMLVQQDKNEEKEEIEICHSREERQIMEEVQCRYFCTYKIKSCRVPFLSLM